MNDYKIDELYVGMKKSFKASISKEDMLKFQEVTGDYNPLHCDDEYARINKKKGCIAYGFLTASYLSTLAGVYLPGEKSLIHSVEFKCKAPVYPGDILKIEGIVESINISFNFIVINCRIYNQNGICVLRGSMQVGVRS